MINLDVGSGTIPIEGFVGVDPYNTPKNGVKAFAENLPYEDNSVDEIYSSHALEHIVKLRVVPTLKEWYRVLKLGGKLTVRVPDLAWCCNWWLNHPTDGWNMDIIFGGQSNEGEFHKTGFSKEIMLNYLREAGFKIKKFEELETHSQQTLHFECIK